MPLRRNVGMAMCLCWGLLVPFSFSASMYSSLSGSCRRPPWMSSSSSLSETKAVAKNAAAARMASWNDSTLESCVSMIPRGGSLYAEDEDESSLIVRKLRNVIRSMMEMGERTSPTLTNLFRSIIGMLETISGTKLLPEKKKKSNKKKKTKKEEIVKEPKKKKGTKKTNESKATAAKATDSAGKKKKVSGAAAAHIAKELKSNNPNYRIQRELKEFLKSPPPNLKVNVGKNIRIWIITLTGAKNTIYEGEKYRLRVQFPADYPTSPPSVYFLQPTPRHEHVYTNGDICLSLLGKDWRPTMTAQSIAMSILSILSGAQRKSLPMDNARNALNKPGAPQDDWVYHDDNC